MLSFLKKRPPVMAVATIAVGVLGLVWLIGRTPKKLDRVYTIGTDDAYPYHYLNSAGQPEGMAAEIVVEAARRAGIRLLWQLKREGPSKALGHKSVDLWPMLSDNRVFVAKFHVTAPYMTNSYVAVFRDPTLAARGGLKRVKSVTLVGYTLVNKLARATFPGAAIVNRDSRERAFAGFCSGEADAFFSEARAAQHLALKRPPACDGITLYTYGADVPPGKLGIASIKEHAEVAERLRAEIDQMLADRTVERILQRWYYYYGGEAETLYREAEAQSATRLSRMLAVSLSVLSVLLLLLLCRVRRAQRAAVAANAAKSIFVASMSHEIRTPMNGILGMVDLARHTQLPGEREEYLGIVKSSADALLRVLNDILDFSKLEAGQMLITTLPFRLKDLVREACATMQPRAWEKGLKLAWHVEPAVPEWFEGDDGRIRQVLLNLLGNAVKFTGQGEVRVMVKAASGELRFEVSDTGIGVPEKHRDAIFEVFQQGDGSMCRKYGGTGLGLSICRKLALAMGGGIRVTSQMGQGSTFEFWVQVRQIEAPPLGAGEITKPTVSGKASSKLAVLLAEDNPVNQKLAIALLQRRGHLITLAANGVEAVEMATTKAFDIVLMDVQMPGMDGLEATRRIRESETGTGRRIPIVAMTAHAMAEDRNRCILAGMDDAVVKPFKPEDLYRAIEERQGETPPLPEDLAPLMDCEHVGHQFQPPALP